MVDCNSAISRLKGENIMQGLFSNSSESIFGKNNQSLLKNPKEQEMVIIQKKDPHWDPFLSKGSLVK